PAAAALVLVSVLATLGLVAGLIGALVWQRDRLDTERGLRERAERAGREASTKAVLAQAAQAESRDRLVSLQVRDSTALMERGDYSGALLWSVAALQADSGVRQRERVHRLRIAALVRGIPRLRPTWIEPRVAAHTQLSSAGRQVALASDR